MKMRTLVILQRKATYIWLWGFSRQKLTVDWFRRTWSFASDPMSHMKSQLLNPNDHSVVSLSCWIFSDTVELLHSDPYHARTQRRVSWTTVACWPRGSALGWARCRVWCANATVRRGASGVRRRPANRFNVARTRGSYWSRALVVPAASVSNYPHPPAPVIDWPDAPVCVCAYVWAWPHVATSSGQPLSLYIYRGYIVWHMCGVMKVR